MSVTVKSAITNQKFIAFSIGFIILVILIIVNDDGFIRVIDDANLLAFAEAGANGLPMPAIPEMSAVWSAWGDAVTLVAQGTITAEEAFTNAAEQIRTTIAEGQ